MICLYQTKDLSYNIFKEKNSMSEFKVEIIQPGQGENCPAGAQCVMHYHGTLADGSVFDSSVDRNEPFEC